MSTSGVARVCTFSTFAHGPCRRRLDSFIHALGIEFVQQSMIAIHGGAMLHLVVHCSLTKTSSLLVLRTVPRAKCYDMPCARCFILILVKEGVISTLPT